MIQQELYTVRGPGIIIKITKVKLMFFISSLDSPSVLLSSLRKVTKTRRREESSIIMITVTSMAQAINGDSAIRISTKIKLQAKASIAG